MTLLPFIIWPLIFLSFALIVGFVLNRLGIKDLGVIFSSAHFFIVCLLALIIYLNLLEPQIEFIWFILMFLDFPITIAYDFATKGILSFIGNSKFDTAVLAPLIFFGTLGTLQYFIVGKVISNLFKWLKTFNK
jgi:hypothetical protein